MRLCGACSSPRGVALSLGAGLDDPSVIDADGVAGTGSSRLRWSCTDTEWTPSPRFGQEPEPRRSTTTARSCPTRSWRT